MICFGSDDNCITVKTKKQFEIVFEVIMKTVEYCKNCMYEVEEMAKKVYKEERV
jgi:isopropylmalate/homocitrate/citramalate synthase